MDTLKVFIFNSKSTSCVYNFIRLVDRPGVFQFVVYNLAGLLIHSSILEVEFFISTFCKSLTILACGYTFSLKPYRFHSWQFHSWLCCTLLWERCFSSFPFPSSFFLWQSVDFQSFKKKWTKCSYRKCIIVLFNCF